MRVSAAMTAQREAAPRDMQLSMSRCWLSSPQTSAHESDLFKRAEGREKTRTAAVLLPWVNGVLEQGKGAQDDILRRSCCGVWIPAILPVRWRLPLCPEVRSDHAG